MISDTKRVENEHLISFCEKMDLSIERGEGVTVWDESGKEYLDLTAGWAVTSLGHAHPVITNALLEQSRKLIHNPNASLTFSPPRARLLQQLVRVLPQHMDKVFFVNSGAEANDAAIKLARKCSGRRQIIAASMGFHGRTIGTTSATGQSVHRDRFNVLVPHFTFVPYDSVVAVEKAIDDDTAAVIVEPVQGEGGVRVPSPAYLPSLSALCREKDILLIIDEIQTGFFRTGPCFASHVPGVHCDFLTMAKGIAGGFPFGAVAVSKEIAGSIETGDHGGTYNGNPLGCAVADSVIRYMLSSHIEQNVTYVGEQAISYLNKLQETFPDSIKDVRGRGLLLAVEFFESDFAQKIYNRCLEKGVILNLKHGTVLRIFPALTITMREMESGLEVLSDAIRDCEGNV